MILANTVFAGPSLKNSWFKSVDKVDLVAFIWDELPEEAVCDMSDANFKLRVKISGKVVSVGSKLAYTLSKR